jgi:hypothetical protein
MIPEAAVEAKPTEAAGLVIRVAAVPLCAPLGFKSAQAREAINGLLKAAK